MNYQSNQESIPLLMVNQQRQQHQGQQLNSASLDDVRNAFLNQDIMTTIQLHNNRLANPMTMEESQNSQENNNIKVAMLTAMIQSVLINMTTVFIFFSLSMSLQSGDADNASLKTLALLRKLIFAFCAILTIAHTTITSISSGYNNALSAHGQRVFIDSEVQRELWEMNVNLQGEIEEMSSLFCENGLTETDARTIWEILSNYPDMFLKTMLAIECNIILPNGPINVKTIALQQAFAFFAGSFLPFLPYVGFFCLERYVRFEDATVPLIVMLVYCSLILFFLGVKRATVFTGPFSFASISFPFSKETPTPQSHSHSHGHGHGHGFHSHGAPIDINQLNMMYQPPQNVQPLDPTHFDSAAFSSAIQTVILGVLCAVLGVIVGKISAQFIPLS